MSGRAWLRAVVVAVLLWPGPAGARPLPGAPGPPPDPSRGESYDGRAPPGEPLSRKVALAVPRLLLVPPRAVASLLRPPVLLAVDTAEKHSLIGAQPVSTLRTRPRSGLVLIGTLDIETIPAVGLRSWSDDIFGPGIARGWASFMTSGPRLNEGRAGIDPNPYLPLGAGLSLRVKRRTDEPYYGLAGTVPYDADGEKLLRYVDVAAAEADARLVVRPGGGAGRWAALLSAGAALRQFAPGSYGISVSPLTTPGYVQGAQFLRFRLGVQRYGPFDPGRDDAGLDLAFDLEPAIGVGFDDSAWITTRALAIHGIPLSRGHAMVLRGWAADQTSLVGEPTFYDRPSLGGWLLRGFPYQRFRGGSAAAVAVDYRWPILLALDGYAFLEYGGAFEEHFQGLNWAGLRPSMGTGIRVYHRDGFLFRALVAIGVGDGFRFALAFDPGS